MVKSYGVEWVVVAHMILVVTLVPIGLGFWTGLGLDGLDLGLGLDNNG